MATTLQEIGLKYNTDKAHYHRFCDFYEKHLPNRGFSGRLIEVGIMDGASLRMWREWYPNAEIVGLDIHIRPRPIEGVTMIEMDATDTHALDRIGEMDIFIDDGSHMTFDQQATFNHVYPNLLRKGGLYVMEDLHTSFLATYINTPATTYELLSRRHDAITCNNNDGQSITMIIPKA
jgi:hypothetical protein